MEGQSAHLPPGTRADDSNIPAFRQTSSRLTRFCWNIESVVLIHTFFVIRIRDSRGASAGKSPRDFMKQFFLRVHPDFFQSEDNDPSSAQRSISVADQNQGPYSRLKERAEVVSYLCVTVRFVGPAQFYLGFCLRVI